MCLCVKLSKKMRNESEANVNLQPGVSSRVKVSDLRGVHSISLVMI